jgi:hypothetical protein
VSSRTEDYVVLVEAFDLKCPLEEFHALVERVMRRLDAEGVDALVSMHFYAAGPEGPVGAVITFANATQMMEHVRMISAWDDFKRFGEMITLTDMRIHGRLTADVEAWIRGWNGPVTKLETYVAGFARAPR